MNLLEILRLECIAVGLESRDKTVTLHEIARIAKNCHVFDNVSEDQITCGLEQREKLGTTGFGKGIAIPHCRFAHKCATGSLRKNHKSNPRELAPPICQN